jgi:hypothetical protein
VCALAEGRKAKSVDTAIVSIRTKANTDFLLFFEKSFVVYISFFLPFVYIFYQTISANNTHSPKVKAKKRQLF